ncbi:MAG: protein kinase [Planctomycetota bacterium]
MSIRRRVIKVGGSLLTHPDLVDKLREYLNGLSPAENWLIVGGGEMVDAIRTLDRLRTLPPDHVHWWCVELLGISFRVVSAWFPDFENIDDADAFAKRAGQAPAAGSFIWVDPNAFYHRGLEAQRTARDPVASLPPHDWRTTSDTIAVFLATRVGADEVHLLKSCSIPKSGHDELQMLQQWADQGIVDEAITKFVAGRPLRVTLAQLIPTPET